ncbi:MAG: hypothetical protein WC477_01770 [Patescibacteria group bacterium]
MHINYSLEKRELALRLFHEGAIKFGISPLRLVHEAKDVSPIHLNLHTKNDPKPGPLSKRSIELMGRLLHEAYTMQMPFDYIIGDPYAGDPIAASFARAGNFPTHKVLWINKRLQGDAWLKEWPIENIRRRPGPTVLIDDILTKAVNKLTTIRLLHRYGFHVPVVAVVIDREQNGGHILLNAGLSVEVVLSLFCLPDLLFFYRMEGLITTNTYAEVCACLGYEQT